ncbi:MAG TPA: DNA polymerase III subunit beta, partial [Longimicrobiaceae bacterium]|nr:DNA polymerase III subunit beta [Longimicrobiaceae bacterium]
CPGRMSATTTVTQDDLQSGIDRVVSVVPRTSALPVTDNVLVEPHAAGYVDLTTTDLSVWARTRIPARNASTPVTTIPARKLKELTARLEAGDVELALSGERMRIASGRSRFNLNTGEAEAFPRPPKLPWETGFDLPGSVLASMAGPATATVSAEGSRSPALHNVLWETSGGTLTLVSTDGHRLTRIRRKLDAATGEHRRVVPVRALSTAVAQLAKAEKVRVAFDDTRVGFRSDLVEIVASLVADPYPDYTVLLRPTVPYARVMEVSREAFHAAVDRMAVLASDQTHRLILNLSGGEVALSVQTPDLGTAEESVPASLTLPGGAFRIAFNAEYLLGLLGSLTCEDVRFSFGESENAAFISPTVDPEKAGEEVTMLCMPLRILEA